MSGTNSGNDSSDFSDSDQAWYDALTGAMPTDPSSPAALDGLALRAALEQRLQEQSQTEAWQAASSEAVLEAGLLRLRQRMIEEDMAASGNPAGMTPAAPYPTAAPDAAQASAAPPVVEDPPRTAQVIEFPWWKRRATWVGLAASVVMAVVLVQQLPPQAIYPLPNEMLGADGLQRIQAPDPRRSVERLAERLRDAGLRPGLFQRDRRFVLDITLMPSDLSVAAPAFDTLGLKPVSGFNRIEVSPP